MWSHKPHLIYLLVVFISLLWSLRCMRWWYVNDAYIKTPSELMSIKISDAWGSLYSPNLIWIMPFLIRPLTYHNLTKYSNVIDPAAGKPPFVNYNVKQGYKLDDIAIFAVPLNKTTTVISWKIGTESVFPNIRYRLNLPFCQLCTFLKTALLKKITH